MKPIVILNIVLVVILSAIIVLLLFERHRPTPAKIEYRTITQSPPVRVTAEISVNGIYEFRIKKTPANAGGLITLDIRSDGTFERTFEGEWPPFPQTRKGTWTLNGDRVILLTDGKTESLRLDGVDLISVNGSRFIRLR